MHYIDIITPITDIMAGAAFFAIDTFSYMAQLIASHSFHCRFSQPELLRYAI
jgi:hypothetical protein